MSLIIEQTAYLISRGTSQESNKSRNQFVIVIRFCFSLVTVHAGRTKCSAYFRGRTSD